MCINFEKEDVSSADNKVGWQRCFPRFQRQPAGVFFFGRFSGWEPWNSRPGSTLHPL